MKCPNCSHTMHQVKTKCHYGIPIVLDQCPSCGGLWFDKSELFRTKHGAAKKIELIDEKILGQIKPLKKERLKCPQDDAKLRIFSDLNFPKEIQIESCPKCGGFWFNRGEFAKYQDIKEKKIKQREAETTPKKDDKFESQVAKLLELHSKKGVASTIGTLGKFLATPVDRYTLTPIPQMKEKQDSTFTAANIVLDIIRTVLMLLIRR